MALKDKVMEQIKTAMKEKNQIALESLRAIKSEILLLETNGTNTEVSEEQEIKLLQKLVKQRRESADTYTSQGRNDLAEPELAQAEVISSFLPKQLSEIEIKEVVEKLAKEIGASGMTDMGRLMGAVSKELSGQADGKTISGIVKALLS